MRFLNDAKKNEYTAKKRAHKQDIVEEMITYNNEGFALLLAHKVSSFSSDCPVYHCGVGFKHPKLKPYLAKFNTGAVQERGFIIDTLNHDPDPERRAAAVFLIGHFLDPHEIISLLSSHISDKDEDVRNNVMRVIATTMVKAKINTIDVMPFLDALDSPYATDRNKALYVLFVASNDKKSQGVILQKGGAKLLSLARLKQPNNHYWAYGILKKISGQDFGPTNIVAWSAWVSSAKKQSA